MKRKVASGIVLTLLLMGMLSIILTQPHISVFVAQVRAEANEETTGIYNFIESLSKGSVVILSFDFGPSTYLENKPQARAILSHCKQRELKVIGVAFWATGAPTGEDVFGEVYGENFETLPEYGTELVYIGFIPGGAVGMSTFAGNTWLAISVDHFGNSFLFLPLMGKVRGTADFDLWMELQSGTPGVLEVITYVQTPHGGPGAVPVGVGCTEVSYPGIKLYYDSGQLVGILRGLQGTSEYKWLSRPLITILSPENTTYATSSVPLNFTVSKSTSWIGYSLNGQANVTIIGNSTLSDLPEGSHNFIVYANDTAGIVGASEMVYFNVETPSPEPFPVEIIVVIVAVAVIGTVVFVYFIRFKK